MSFAIPTSVALTVIEQLKDNGRVERGWLGVSIQNVDKELAESFKLDKPQGALINSVIDNGPADQGGILPGDVIIRFNGDPIIESSDLPHVVGMLTPGQQAEVEVYREGKRKRLNVVVGALDKDEESVANLGDGSDRLGLMVQDLTDRQIETLRLRGGALVTTVSPNSAAARTGIREGDIVVQIGYSRISDVDAYSQIITKLPKNKQIAIRFYRQGRAIFRTIIID